MCAAGKLLFYLYTARYVAVAAILAHSKPKMWPLSVEQREAVSHCSLLQLSPLTHELSADLSPNIFWKSLFALRALHRIGSGVFMLLTSKPLDEIYQ